MLRTLILAVLIQVSFWSDMEVKIWKNKKDLSNMSACILPYDKKGTGEKMHLAIKKQSFSAKFNKVRNGRVYP